MHNSDEIRTERVPHWVAARRMFSIQHLRDSLQIDVATFPWLGLVVGAQAAIGAVVAIVLTFFSP